MINPAVFREYDVRGVVDKDLTFNFAYDLGRSLGTFSIPGESELWPLEWTAVSAPQPTVML